MHDTTTRLLNDHDQPLSDRAVDAAARSDFEQRAEAWRVALRLGDGPLGQVSVYGAFLLLLVGDGIEYPVDADVRHFAGELEEVHRNHTAATEARKAAG